MPVFSKSQIAAAGLLVSTGGLRPAEGLPPGTFVARSSAGKFEYVCDHNGCNCPATGPCKHVCAVLLLTAKFAVDEAERAAESCKCRKSACEHALAYDAALNEWFAVMGVKLG